MEEAVCRCCTTVRRPEAADALAWGLDRVDGALRWLCPVCVRDHARDIEAKLPDEWWG